MTKPATLLAAALMLADIIGKSSFRWLRAGIVLVLLFGAGCTTQQNTAPTVETTPGVERWICGDYFDDCGLISTDCVTLTANLRDGTGEVKFSGFVERTEFRIDGQEARYMNMITNSGTTDLLPHATECATINPPLPSTYPLSALLTLAETRGVEHSARSRNTC